jgi:Flp pilus assembly protein TadG
VIRLAASLRTLAGDSRGVTIVEFAFVAPVLLLMLIGGFDLAHQSYVRSVMQGALNDAARRAAVEDPEFGSEGDTVEERVEAMVSDRLASVAPDATISVTQENYFDFSGIGNPEKLMTDKNKNGKYDAVDKDCFADLNENGEYDTDTGRDGVGGANDVVFYQATLTMPRLVPLHAFLNVPGDYNLAAETAIRNQPYAVQATPPVVCGAGA